MDRLSPAGPARFWQGEAANLSVLIAVSLAVRIGYLLVKPADVYSIDVQYWQHVVSTMAAGDNPYRTGLVPYLPVWPAVLYLVNTAAEFVGVSFVAALWAGLIAIETGLLIAIYRVLRRSVGSGSARNILLVAIALNPAAIFQVTQHGNFDVLFMLFVVLAIDAMIQHVDSGLERDWLRACAFLGLGIVTKTIPLVLVPLLAGGARKVTGRRRVLGGLLVIFPVMLGLAIVLAFSGAPGVRDILMYRSVHGYFGISGWLARLDGVEYPALGPWLRLHGLIFTLAMPVMMAGIAFWLWKGGWKDSRRIALLAGLSLIAVAVLGPGFGTQYIYWLIPPLAISYGQIADPRWRRLLIGAWVILAITYSFDYLFNPGLGATLHAIYPHSEAVYLIQQWWHRPIDQTLLRLPMFLVFVAMLIEGMRQIRSPQPVGQALPAGAAL